MFMLQMMLKPIFTLVLLATVVSGRMLSADMRRSLTDSNDDENDIALVCMINCMDSDNSPWSRFTCLFR